MSQADFFLKIKGIEGESIDAKNSKELQIVSWGFGVSNTGSSGIGGGAAVGKANLQDFHFTVQHGKPSANIFKFCTIGKHIDECVLTCRKATGDGGQVPYLVVTFQDVFISSYQIGGSDGSGSLPMEQISFNFTKIKFETKEQKKDGSIGNGPEATYDVKTNKAT